MAHGWAGSARDLVGSDPTATLHRLSDQHQALYGDPPSSGQSNAWVTEMHWLTAALRSVESTAGWGVILEYELPFEGGRRLDAVVLSGSSVLVLEFKQSFALDRAHIDQADAYARDLAEYHTACRGSSVLPILIYLDRGSLDTSFEGVRVIGPDILPSIFREHANEVNRVGLREWAEGRYEPLPSLVAAARRIFNHEPLPRIRRAESAGIPALLASLHDLVREAEEGGDRHLVLITGVPGSGKTLVGLQFVYNVTDEGRTDATFYSGNGPLVEVLRDALRSKVFVNHWRNFDLEAGARGVDPPAHVLVFDEAQRAWDRTRMRAKQQINLSEPDLVIAVAERLRGWAVIVGLIGEGQEIYLGEEAGLTQWAEAVRDSGGRFAVHTPTHLADTFAGLDLHPDDRLNLTTSLRTHRADASHAWVTRFLAGDLAGAMALAIDLRSMAFDMYVTSDLHAAKAYMYTRYAAEPEKRFGMLASSRAGNLAAIGINNRERWPRYVEWFNAPKTHPLSSCQLVGPVTEFHCQGLEVDMPLVCWGDDLGWDQGWRSFRVTRDARDSHQLRLNSYRVLLTRGRDGFVVYLPPNLRTGQGQQLHDTLTSSGVEQLPTAPAS
jgi:schlafen family protein